MEEINKAKQATQQVFQVFQDTFFDRTIVSCDQVVLEGTQTPRRSTSIDSRQSSTLKTINTLSSKKEQSPKPSERTSSVKTRKEMIMINNTSTAKKSSTKKTDSSNKSQENTVVL